MPEVSGKTRRKSDKVWRDALTRALARRGDEGGVVAGLDVIADQVVNLAASGDMQAIKELGDRMDGRPLQQTENTTEVTVTHVDARKRLAGKLDTVIEHVPAQEPAELTH